jgi:FtsZ-binding cell division protein ZapB
MMSEPLDGPLEQRSTLEKQIAAAWKEYEQSTQKRQAGHVALNQARRDVTTRHKSRAAGIASSKEVTAAEEKLKAAEEAYERHLASANAALDTTKALELDLTTLLRRHPDLFAEQAEQATQAAATALKAAADALRASQRAWQQAQAAWLPLAQGARLVAR